MWRYYIRFRETEDWVYFLNDLKPVLHSCCARDYSRPSSAKRAFEKSRFCSCEYEVKRRYAKERDTK